MRKRMKSQSSLKKADWKRSRWIFINFNSLSWEIILLYLGDRQRNGYSRGRLGSSLRSACDQQIDQRCRLEFTQLANFVSHKLKNSTSTGYSIFFRYVRISRRSAVFCERRSESQCSNSTQVVSFEKNNNLKHRLKHNKDIV